MREPSSANPASTVPVLLPLLLDAPYDYLPPENGAPLRPGDFVVAPLGSGRRVGVVWDEEEARARPAVEPGRLRRVIGRLDLPPLPAVSRRFCAWVARYTLAPRGMVLRMMMSAPQVFEQDDQRWGYALAGPPPARLNPGRQRVIEAAAGGLVWSRSALAEAAAVSAAVIDGLVEAGTLRRAPLPREPFPCPEADFAPPALSESQAGAAHALRETARAGRFAVTLLDGVTGSGKTEVYFEAVAEAIAQGRQALVLLPEIALTSQFLARFGKRFGCPPAEWHSGVTAQRRARLWRAVAAGEARVVLGARSALFLPFPELGLIVVDEEHDGSYKQDDAVCYQARDMAVARAHLGGIPIVLASATPSIESLVNAVTGRYRHVRLESRFHATALPSLAAVDLRQAPPERGRWLSPVLVQAVAETLGRGHQALLFLNRRGYAPLTLCRKCGHRFECPHCTGSLVEHRFRRRLACHHCGFTTPSPTACPKCKAEGTLTPCGPGVERVAEEAAALFPDAPAAILSSDLLPGLAALRAVIEQIAAGETRLIIGTQIVAKGHHFPRLALVGVVDGDLSLSQSDPRAAERTFQLLNQVTGRAGREIQGGRGLIQTHMPEHPVMQALVSGAREDFFAYEIAQREAALMPPFGRLAALIVSGADRPETEAYARAVRFAAPPAPRIETLGPAEAPLALIRNRRRYRILVKAAREVDLQGYLRLWLERAPPAKGSMRVDVDVDPYNFL